MSTYSEILQILQRLAGYLLRYSVHGGVSLDPGVVDGLQGCDTLIWIVLEKLLNEVLGFITDIVPLGLF